MAYTFYIDPAVNCVFVRHFDVYDVDDTLDQYREMIGHPQYAQNMNVLRDVLSTSLPPEFGFKFFAEQTPKRYKDIEPIMGQSKVAWVLGTGKDFATMHQFTLTTRFKPPPISRAGRSALLRTPKNGWMFRRITPSAMKVRSDDL